jgi:hypothetical protein
MKGPSPLLGYNTNVRHKGKLYHIQTEDSGIRHPHVITHLFADGGRIVASKKTSYAEHVGADDYQAIVKQLMREQHKSMFIDLRDGVYDESEEALEARAAGAVDAATTPGQVSAPEAAAVATAEVLIPPPEDFDELDRAAHRIESGSVRRDSPGLYRSTTPAVEVAGRKPESRPPESIFGSDLLSEKSLDEVILGYLAEDLDESTDE